MFVVRFYISVLSLLFVGAIFASVANAQIEITDSHGKYRFDAPPKRVVVLNWALAEQMLELGEVPVGMSDISAYQRHTGKQSVPLSVVDVGERLVPKLSEIRALKPDVILIGYSQRPFIRPLSNIATVIYFKNFGKRYNNQEKSRDRFTELAKLFDKTELADKVLGLRQERLALLKKELHEYYADQALPAVQFVVPDASNAAKKGVSLVFGENSMPFYAAQALGLEVVGAKKNDQFGVAQLTTEQLTKLKTQNGQEICQVYLSSYVSGDLEDVSQTGCIITPNYQNAFGGVMSVLYLAESLVQGLKSRVTAAQ